MNIKTNVQPKQKTIEKLIAEMSSTPKYDYLKIVLSKTKTGSIGQPYLMVTREGFGLVKLLNT